MRGRDAHSVLSCQSYNTGVDENCGDEIQAYQQTRYDCVIVTVDPGSKPHYGGVSYPQQPHAADDSEYALSAGVLRVHERVKYCQISFNSYERQSQE